MDADTLVGTLPNVYRQAVSLDELRASPTFDALPPAAALALAGPDTWRYVRQDDPLWGRLHPGRLTSGYVAAALGLYEPAAAARLKIGKSRASHGRLLEAWRHLCQEPYCPATNPHITAESAAVHNSGIIEAYNREGGAGEELVAAAVAVAAAAEEQGPVSPPEGEVRANGAVEAPNGPRKKNKKKKGRRKAAPPALAPATSGYGGSTNGTAGPLTEDVKLRKARHVGSQGLLEVRCAWGKAQEGAALRVLGAAFPDSRLGEVGLCVPDTIPSEWKFAPGDLPNLGSSPDGVIRHLPGPLPPLPGAAAPGDDGDAEGLENEEERLNGGIERRESLVEVVEVKNSCPFDVCRHGRGGGGGRRRYVVCDRGPRRQLDPLWIPQLQMHMLCTGTASAILISRSASRGARLFRVAADPELQRLMLCVLRQLWTAYVLPRKSPPLNAFEAMPEHAAMLRRIREVAVAADAAVGEISGEQAVAALRGLDSRYFLD